MYTLKLKIKTVFSKIKIILMKTHINFVCIYELEQSRTNLSFIFYLKHKILTVTKLDSSLKNLLLKIFFSFLTWFKS